MNNLLIKKWPLLFLIASVLLSACSLVSVDKKTRYRDAEGYFDPKLLTQIQPGETTRAWLVAHFGEPLFVDHNFRDPQAVAADVHVSTWAFTRQQQKNTSVFLLFRARNRSEQNEYLHVVVADERVVKAWRDEFEAVDTRRVMNALGYAAAPYVTPPTVETAPVEPSATVPIPSDPVVPPAESVAPLPPPAAVLPAVPKEEIAPKEAVMPTRRANPVQTI